MPEISINTDNLVNAIDDFREEGVTINVEMSYMLILQLALGLFLAIALAMILASYVTK
jgi:secreted protein with Ig-like and vWFA domain